MNYSNQNTGAGNASNKAPTDSQLLIVSKSK